MMGAEEHVSGNGSNPSGTHHLKYFAVKTIAEQFDVSPRTVHRWIKDKKLVVHRIGHSVRVSEVDLKLFFLAHRGDG
jgi:excisionase family DNA binding protein